ncbi:MAG TPA: NHLP bacteriocin export ABC transporter permease/ATPase subunit [Aggregatilineales bacterium]|nr:NHLP bacteriocin export ABC transporter permease/ATPase subunit [Anaerolineales bacterium]HRE47650.1 NHLP bacteriocin export ABC transporter permease/ATPase subunit [Aggregatilineales bacterium]
MSVLSRLEAANPPNDNDFVEMLLLERFKADYEQVPVASNKPIILNDPASVYLVFRGRVDVFSAPIQEGNIVGQRQHRFRADAPLLVMGVSAEDTGYGFLVTGGGETEALRVTRSRFQELAAQDENRAAIAALLNGWLINLYSGLVRGVPPKEYTQLEAGKTTSLKLDAIARATRGVVWVRAVEGELRYLGRTDVPALDAALPFPAAGAMWLQAARSSKVEAIDTAALLTHENGWEVIDSFDRFVMREIVTGATRADAAERERLKNRSASDTIRVSNALQQLAAPLAAEGSRDFPADMNTEDPLLAACQIVGTDIGIAVRPHPDMLRGKKLRNPLQDIAKASRFRTRSVALKEEWWKTDSGPLLGYWEEGKRPVALIAETPGTYVVRDPATRKEVPVTAEVADNLSYFAHAFYRPFPETPLTGWQVLRFAAKGIWRDLLTVVLMGLFVGVLTTATPLVTGIIFESVIPGSDRAQLLQLGIVLIMVFLASAAFTMTRSIAILRVEGRVSSTVQGALWDRLINLPTPFFRRYASGDLAARALGLEVIREAITGPTINALLSGIFSIFNLFVLLAFDARVAGVAMLLVIVAVGVTMGFGLAQVRIQRQITAQQGKISGLILQIVSGVAKFRTAGAENRAFSLWAKEFSEQKTRSFRARIVRNYLITWSSVFPILATMLIFAATRATGREVSTGGFIAFYTAFTLFLGSALELGMVFVGLYAVLPQYERVKPILEMLPEVDSTKSDPSEITGDIEVSHVSFKYKDDGPLILRDVSFHIQGGEFVALVGASGSGKSTMLRLLLGFEMPESGAIFYNGQDLAGLDVRAVRRQLGVVLQSSQLMAGTIYENIVGQAGLSIDEAWVAARMAGLEEDIKAMPMGMHTVIGEGGSTFSGGQKQRLLIARAIVTKPRVMFFDEATSALDNRTQEVVTRSLDTLDATRIVIAHRLSTIINAHRIIVMERGEVVQQGSYKELVGQAGLFADLARRQLT